jgi:hypothetical protein
MVEHIVFGRVWYGQISRKNADARVDIHHWSFNTLPNFHLVRGECDIRAICPAGEEYTQEPERYNRFAA